MSTFTLIMTSCHAEKQGHDNFSKMPLGDIMGISNRLHICLL